MKVVKTLMVIIFSMSVFQLAATENTPTSAISTTVNTVLEIMQDARLTADDMKHERRKKIRSVIQKRFDFEEMAKRSLARHWKQRTPAEKSEFVSIFSELLEASYIGKIEAYTNEKVTYDKETIKGNGKYGVVNTSVITKDLTIPIDYKVINKDGTWFIYDVIIEGVSFISTYRSQYNKIIMRESYAQLIEKMKTKLTEVNAL